ncbi:MAG: hypothetical protein K2X93_04775 [Candidatus Obscuribacterales bacterium]|nr:hypothetical protein [Candidatus Obscuribacterales bacterium]
MTDNLPELEGAVFNPLQDKKNVSDALYLCAYSTLESSPGKIEHPWKSHGNKSEGVDEDKGVYRTVYGRDELPIKTTTFPIGDKSKEAAADYKTGNPCYRHSVYKDGSTRSLRFSHDASSGKMRVEDKNGESTVTAYSTGVEFKRTSKDDNQITKFAASSFAGTAKLEHRTRGNLAFSWDFDVTNGLTMKDHGALDRPNAVTKYTTDGNKIQYSLNPDGELNRSSYKKTKMTEPEQKQFKALSELLDRKHSSDDTRKTTAADMLKQLQRWGSYDFLSGEQRDTKKIPAISQTKSTPLKDGLGTEKPKEQSEKKAEAPSPKPERPEDKLVRDSVDAVLGMDKNDYKYLVVRAALLDTYEKTPGKPDAKMNALEKFVSRVNKELKGRGSISIETLDGKLAETVREAENAKDADSIIAMRLQYGTKNFGPLSLALRSKK